MAWETEMSLSAISEYYDICTFTLPVCSSEDRAVTVTVTVSVAVVDVYVESKAGVI